LHLARIGSVGYELVCERRPTTQAIEYLLGEALARSAGGVAVADERHGTVLRLTINSALPRRSGSQRAADAGSGLSVGLARLLLQAQGFALGCSSRADGTWSAVVSFPAGH
jgi:hypothetical protein